MDCSPPGSSVHGILQARMILEWVAMPSSRDLLCLDTAKYSLAICLFSPLKQEAGLRQKWRLDKLTEPLGWVQGDGQQGDSGHSTLGLGGSRQLCQRSCLCGASRRPPVAETSESNRQGMWLNWDASSGNCCHHSAACASGRHD